MGNQRPRAFLQHASDGGRAHAATVAVAAVRRFVDERDPPLDQVLFVCFDDENLRLYQELLS